MIACRFPPRYRSIVWELDIGQCRDLWTTFALKMVKPEIGTMICSKPSCPRQTQHVLEFSPANSNITHQKRARFRNAVEALKTETDEAKRAALIDVVWLTRTMTCRTCRGIQKKTQSNPKTKFGACRAKHLELKAQMQKMGCILCGRTDAMTVEHKKPEEKMRDKKGKTVNLSSYTKWTVLGGPDAMQAEFDKPSVVVMCYNCQLMQPTHDAMKPKIDPAALPDGKSRGTEEEDAAFHKKYNLTIIREKQAYVDPIKLQIGQCTDCSMKMVPWGSEWTPGQSGYPHAFQFAHRSELDKGDGVAEIVHSTTKLATVKPLLDKEIARSRLLCQCCGKVETDARKTAPGPSEEGN